MLLHLTVVLSTKNIRYLNACYIEKGGVKERDGLLNVESIPEWVLGHRRSTIEKSFRMIEYARLV